MTNKKRTLPDGCYKIKILDVMNCKEYEQQWTSFENCI